MRFIVFLLSLSFFVSSEVEAKLLLDKIYPFHSYAFSFSDINTVSFNIVTSDVKLQPDLRHCLETVVGKKIQLVCSKKTDPVNFDALRVKLQFFILLIKFK